MCAWWQWSLEDHTVTLRNQSTFYFTFDIFLRNVFLFSFFVSSISLYFMYLCMVFKFNEHYLLMKIIIPEVRRVH